jgi:hypothetical protein
MAARQPTPAELKEALSLLKQLKKGYADLGQENPFASINADNIQDIITQSGGVKNILTQWTLELDKVEDNLEGVGKSAKGLFQQFNNIVGEIKKGNQNIDIGAKSMGTFQKNAEKLKNDQQGITRLSKIELETLQRQNKQAASNLDIANKALQNQINRGSLEGEELQRAQTLLAERQEEATSIKDLLSLTEERLEKEQKIQETLGIGGKLLDGLKKIPILGDILDVGGAKKAMEEAADEGASGFQAMGKGIKALGPSLKAALGPLALIGMAVEAIKFFVDAMFDANKQSVDLARNLSVSTQEGEKLRQYYIDNKNLLQTQYKTTAAMVEAQTQLSELSSLSNVYSLDALDAQTQLTKEVKLQAEDASNLNKIFIANGDESTKALDNAYDTVAEYANQNKVLFDSKKILSQASKVSGQLLVSFKGSTTELIKAVMQANKLGISLEQAKGISQSMLDFESSISAELEAELLTGKNLNLEAARSLALQGDFVGAAAEALKNVKSLEEFQGMNVIQQEALAKAAGLTVDQLSDALIQQKFQGTETGEQIKRLKEAGMVEQANALAAGKLVGENLKAATQQLNAQEKFNLAIEQGKEIFSDLVSGGALQTLADALQGLANSSLIKGYAEEGEAKRIERELQEKNKTTPGSISQKDLDIAKSATDQKTVGEQAGKIAGYTAAGAAIGSIIPGVGTLIGAGVGAITGIVANAYSRESRKEDLVASKKIAETQQIKGYDKNEIKVNDFIIRTHPKDELVMAGGTNLGKGGNEEVTLLLKELVTAVKSGGNVYLDGNKVGTAMGMSTFKTQ